MSVILPDSAVTGKGILKGVLSVTEFGHENGVRFIRTIAHRRIVLRPCYNVPVDKTLTLRLEKSQDQALTRRAKTLGITRSELVRRLIIKDLEEQPLGRHIGHLKGSLELPTPKSGWQRRIKERNWR